MLITTKKKQHPTERKNFHDYTGQRFGRVVVLEYDCKRRDHYWKVRCDCGTEFYVGQSSLLCGHTKSCGCLRADKNGERLKSTQRVKADTLEKCALWLKANTILTDAEIRRMTEGI